jgi:ribosomal protein S27AE
MSMDSRIRCSKCGTDHGFKRAEIEGDNTGCLIFAFGGLLPYLLFSSNQKDRVVCTRCGYVFSPPTRTSKSDVILVAVLIALILAVVIVCWLN